MDDQNDILLKIFSKVMDIDAKMFTKDEAREMESRLLTHVDGFIKLHGRSM